MPERIFLKGGDVVSMEANKNITRTSTSKVSEIKKHVHKLIRNNKHQEWLKDGVECEVLLANGGGWIKGKVQFVCEFIPEDREQFGNSEINTSLKIDERS